MRNVSLSVSFLHVAVTIALTAQFAYSQKITTFDVPNGIDTTPAAISPSGQIVGYYGNTKTLEVNGFIRKADGAITSLDCPGPGTVTFCALTGISPSGEAVGYEYPVLFGGENYGVLSFLRKSNGTVSSFGTSFGEIGEGAGLYANAIDRSGEIVGTWNDVEEIDHGFLREPDGTITTFDIDPHKFYPGTTVTAVNPAGVITGFGNDFNVYDSRLHGFVRQADGTITTFDVLNATNTYASAINSRDQIAGTYTDAASTDHGFVREPDGNITTFDVPGAVNTVAVAINSEGRILGRYGDANFKDSHGFLREADGSITKFDVPNSAATIPEAMNESGDITGVFTDAKGDEHGFVLHHRKLPLGQDLGAELPQM
jgi:uncharacterized membrane protein